MNLIRLTGTLSLSLLGISGAFATNLLTNGSFESGTFLNGQNPSGDFLSMQVFAGDTNITGWTITADMGNDVHWAENGNGFGWVASHGARMIDLSGWSDVNNGAFMTQDFGAVAGQQYQLDFDIGVDSTFTQGGQVAISAGIGGASQTETLSLPNGWQGVYWEHRTLFFTAANNNDVVHFQGLSSPFCIGLDNASVQAVPEPATLSAGIFGLAVVGVRRRRARRQSQP